MPVRLPAMEFRSRDYDAEAKTLSLPRISTDSHPLAVSPPSSSFQDPSQFTSQNNPNSLRKNVGNLDNDVYDPLRSGHNNQTVDVEALPYSSVPFESEMSSSELLRKEWNTFKKFLLQKCPPTKSVSVSSISAAVVKSAKAHEKSSIIPLNELEDQQKVDEQEGVMSISQQEYVAKLSELKSQIVHAWNIDDRITSLKLSMKVARLLMDTDVSQFYPTLFSLATEILDMLGDMVWKRIKQKAECLEDGTQICCLPEDFKASDVCSEAKETCYNWFCKIGSIRELLPRIYLELALFPCWRFLLDRPDKVLHRLVMMTRGLAHPLASAYCHLYIAYCGKKLQNHDRGLNLSLFSLLLLSHKSYAYIQKWELVESTRIPLLHMLCKDRYLLNCINEINISLLPSIAQKDITDGISSKSKDIIISLIEPTIEYIIKCIFQDPNRQVNQILVELGVKNSESHISRRCISLILHHLLKELPVEFINASALDLLQLIQFNSDVSFLQCNNFRLLGFRLTEQNCSTDVATAIVKKIIEVVNQYNNLDEFLKVVDAYVDILLQNQMINYLQIILGDIATRACSKWTSESEMDGLRSILVKCLTNLSLEDALKLEHFSEILNVLRGRSRGTVSALILSKAIRNSYISEQSTIQFLFKVAQGLHQRDESTYMTHDGDQQLTPLLSRFVQMVDYGKDLEGHLSFLADCRGAFADIDELKVSIVHMSNNLAIKAVKQGKRSISFIRSCLAFSEVTIPSISGHMKQLHLYLETAEVALLCNLIGQSDGFVDSALSCLQSLVLISDARQSVNSDEVVSVIRKLCNLILFVPGNPNLGATYMPKSLLTLVNSQSWATVRVKTRTLCGVVSLLAALAQNRFQYHIASKEVLSNDLLFFGDSSYHEDLKSYSGYILGSICDTVQQEHSKTARGRLALEACNCIALSFKMNDEVVSICNKLVEIAKSCLSASDRFLQSTINFMDTKLRD
ncbi:hypothetical protein V2J09_024305 [Rumex salicifolius]